MDRIQKAKEMQMIRLRITMLVIILIYFLQMLSSRSAMETQDHKHLGSGGVEENKYKR